jgi:hypothetical protein
MHLRIQTVISNGATVTSMPVTFAATQLQMAEQSLGLLQGLKMAADC